MKCFHPYVTRAKGAPVRSSSGAILGYRSRYVEVPCGHCSACLQARRQSWAFRIQVESEQYPGSSFFVSLTYNDDCLPYGSDHPSLCKADLTRFFHRLRSYLYNRDPSPEEGRKYFRYFGCGEYGDSFGRPHYHFCFWDLFFKYSIDQWLSIFQDVWRFCDPTSVDIEDMSPRRAEYVAKYCLKQAGIDYKAHGVEPPFAIMSRRPGIGQNFITPLNISRVRSNGGLQVFDSTGCKFSLPRYYRDSGAFYSQDELRSISDRYHEFQDRVNEATGMYEHTNIVKYHRARIMQEYNILRKLREDSFGKDFI